MVWQPYGSSLFFNCWIVSHCIDMSDSLSIHLLMAICIVWSFDRCQSNCCEHSQAFDHSLLQSLSSQEKFGQIINVWSIRVESWLSSQTGFLLWQGTQVRFPASPQVPCNCLQTETPAIFINFPALVLPRHCHFEIMQKTNKNKQNLTWHF